jgi:hypothetical protein
MVRGSPVDRRDLVNALRSFVGAQAAPVDALDPQHFVVAVAEGGDKAADFPVVIGGRR